MSVVFAFLPEILIGIVGTISIGFLTKHVYVEYVGPMFLNNYDIVINIKTKQNKLNCDTQNIVIENENKIKMDDIKKEKGKEKIKNYIKPGDNNFEYDIKISTRLNTVEYYLKIGVIGGFKVGKTFLLSKLCEKNLESKYKFVRTMGINMIFSKEHLFYDYEGCDRIKDDINTGDIFSDIELCEKYYEELKINAYNNLDCIIFVGREFDTKLFLEISKNSKYLTNKIVIFFINFVPDFTKTNSNPYSDEYLKLKNNLRKQFTSIEIIDKYVYLFKEKQDLKIGCITGDYDFKDDPTTQIMMLINYHKKLKNKLLFTIEQFKEDLKQKFISK